MSHAVDFSGRASIFAFSNEKQTLTADQQSLRLMLDNAKDNNEWSVHLKTSMQHLKGIPFSNHSSNLFRYNKLSHNWVDENKITQATRVGYEVDRLFYKHQFNKLNISLGRQAIDWGSGRFWQPLNIFGSFAPTDLDTDYKPGIDATRLEWFPSNYSSLTAVYAFSPNDNINIKKDNNTALHYKSQIGNDSEFSLLAANIIDHSMIGASFESSWKSIGWRVEAAHYKNTSENFTFLIAGFDYQFNNGALLSTEWYHNSRGVNNSADFVSYPSDTFTLYGLQQHLSKNILGLSLNKDINPLLNGGYTLLIGSASLLHQLNFSYSLSNESDFLLSLQTANGEGLTSFAQQQSEFGHIPTSISFRLRYYF